jgi:hypothetical protein
MRAITERMAEAMTEQIARCRVPRVYYLAADEYERFAATNPPTVEAMFALPLGHKPSPMTCLAFRGVAVRKSAAKPNGKRVTISRLICHAGTSVNVSPK